MRGSVWTLEISLNYFEVSAAGFLVCARGLVHLRTVQVGNQFCTLGIFWTNLLYLVVLLTAKYSISETHARPVYHL